MVILLWISFIYIVHVVTLLVSQSLGMTTQLHLEGPQYATVLEYLHVVYVHIYTCTCKL